MRDRFFDIVVFRSGTGGITWQRSDKLNLFDALTDFIVEGRTTEILGRYPDTPDLDTRVAIAMAQRAAHKYEEQDT